VHVKLRTTLSDSVPRPIALHHDGERQCSTLLDADALVLSDHSDQLPLRLCLVKHLVTVRCRHSNKRHYAYMQLHRSITHICRNVDIIQMMHGSECDIHLIILNSQWSATQSLVYINWSGGRCTAVIKLSVGRRWLLHIDGKQMSLLAAVSPHMPPSGWGGRRRTGSSRDERALSRPVAVWLRCQATASWSGRV